MVGQQSAAWCWEVCRGEGKISLRDVLLAEQCRGLDAISVCLPGGSYTTFRTYNYNYALLLDDHLQRLETSAELSEQQIQVNSNEVRQGLRLAIAEVQQREGRQLDLRIRLTLDLDKQPGRVFISAEELHTPDKKAYTHGVKVVTSHVERSLPAAKLTGFIQRAGEERRSLPADAFEAVMVDSAGRLKEGLSSNFFAVLNGVLWTAGEGVLPGVTRSLVLESAQRLGIPVRLEATTFDRIGEFEEAFLTSSSRGVVPVIQVDELPVGEGKPGDVTHRIAVEFDRLIKNKLAAI